MGQQPTTKRHFSPVGTESCQRRGSGLAASGWWSGDGRRKRRRYSKNGGVTFSDPTRVNPPQRYGYEPGVNVDQYGTIYVTAHKSSLTNEGTRLSSFFWYSTDGGETFHDMPPSGGLDNELYALEGDIAVDDAGMVHSWIPMPETTRSVGGRPNPAAQCTTSRKSKEPRRPTTARGSGPMATVSSTDIAQGGILTCAAAGNSATPANGNGAPAAADEAVSVAATGNLDGIAGYSSGGVGAIDEDDGDTYMKPDVTAPGGTLTDLIEAVQRGLPNTPEDEQDPIREYTLKAGTSMASPFTTGTAGLVAEAMEFDAPSGISLSEPADADLDDVLRLKQVLLATASETAFTAAPYHRAHAPTYEFGGRDPYEGYGRVNGDAAVDAVTRELSGTTSETAGLNLPEDSRAVAGYVTAGPGTLTASVEFDYYSGGNKGSAEDDPQLDLFIYDAANPEPETGDPNIVVRATTLGGDSATANASFGRDATESVYYVVAKLTNVPGGVNGDDIQAHFDLSVNVDPGVFVSGTRDDDGSVFTAGQTNQVDITLTEADTEAVVRDTVPFDWEIVAGDSHTVYTEDGERYVEFDAAASADETRTYFAEAPDSTGSDEFGPGQARTADGDTVFFDITGTETNEVGGVES